MERSTLTKLMERTIREVRATLMMDKASAEKTWNVRVDSVEQYKQDRAVALLDAMQFFIDETKEPEKVPDWCDPDTEKETSDGE